MNKEQSEKKKYEAPSTEEIIIETEAMCAGSIVDDNNQDKNAVTIEEQGVGTISNYYQKEDGTFEDWDF